MNQTIPNTENTTVAAIAAALALTPAHDNVDDALRDFQKAYRTVKATLEETPATRSQRLKVSQEQS